MNETMNIYAKQGDKVVFLNDNGHDWEPAHARDRGLVEGAVYTVESTEVGGWHTEVNLKEFPDYLFNSVIFADYKEGVCDMKQIKNMHLEFLEEAKRKFSDNVRMETHSDNDKGLIALRYGADRDCIWIYELGDEVAFFSQTITPTDGRKLLEATGKVYDLELGEVREVVADFSFEMEKQLKANDYKGDWENCTLHHLKNELEKNFQLLMKCTSHSEFRRRCANIANFAMMLADNDKRDEKERSI